MVSHALHDDQPDEAADAYGTTYSDYGYTTARPTLFGREPAMLLNVVSALIALLASAALPLTVDQQGALNAVVAGALGLWVAIKVKGGTWVAALLALAQAIMAGVLAWNFHLAPDVQSGVLALIAVVGGYATRQLVTAPEPPAVPGSSSVA